MSFVHPIVGNVGNPQSELGCQRAVQLYCYHVSTAPTCLQRPPAGPSIHPHLQMPVLVIPSGCSRRRQRQGSFAFVKCCRHKVCTEVTGAIEYGIHVDFCVVSDRLK